MWKKFLARVWGDTRGWACLGYFGTGQDWKQKFYDYPGQLDILLADAARYNRFANVYFSAHLFAGAKRVKENALPIRALWMDKDQGGLEDLDPKPTMCWQTSEGKWQAMWLLDKPIPPSEAERLNRYLTYECLGGEVDEKKDKAGWHLNKMLRLPESINHKYDPPQEGVLQWDDGPEYSFEELDPTPQDEGVRELIGEHADILDPLPKELPTREEALLKYGSKIPQVAWELLSSAPSEQEDWSEGLWRIENLLLEASIPKEAVFMLVKGSAWNKFARDKRPDKDLWGDILKAANNKGPLPEPEEGRLPWYNIGRLLDYSRKPEWVVEDMWMDENVGWLAGVGKSYKSVLSLDLALSIAAGVPFLGRFKVYKPGPVLMVQEEDPLWRVAHRLRAMCQTKGILDIKMSYDDYSFTLDVPSMTDVPLYISAGGGFGFNNEDKVRDLEEAIRTHKPRIVILDPWFMMSIGIDEFKSGEVTTILSLLKHWRNKYGCSICILHHFKKGNGESNERLYGSMALYAWSENSIFVNRKKDGNRVVLERDIKDALELEKVAVEIIDIDETYSFKVSEYEDDVVVEEDIEVGTREQIIDLLKRAGVGREITGKQIREAVQATQKTIAKHIDDLASEGLIDKRTGGRGGKIVVSALPKINGERNTVKRVKLFGYDD